MRDFEIYYHIAVMQSWHLSHEIIQAHFDRTDILDKCRTIYYCVNGDIEQVKMKLNLPDDPKYQLVHLRPDALQYEFPTINFLRNRSGFSNMDVLYLHTKGASQPINRRNGHNNHLDNMCYNCISHYQEARQALNDGYNGAGLAYYRTPFDHFSGNIWWARSEYIRTLPPLIYGVRNFNFYLDYPDRHDAEKWVCSQSDKFFNMTHHYQDSKYFGLTY